MAAPEELDNAQTDAQRAARQAGLLFVMSAVLLTVATASLPDRRDELVVVAVAVLAIGVLTLLLPWRRWASGSTAALAVAAWAVVGGSTWALGGFGVGAGAFFVLAFAWLGLHHTRRTILANAPAAAGAYIVALLLTDAPRQQLTSTVVLIPFAMSIGLIVEGRVRRLREAQAVIEEEQRWRAALMATLAHDVRSPLTTIHGTLEIMADDEDLPDHLRPLVAAAARQTSRLTALASNLLDLERVEGGKLILDRQSVDLTELSEQVAELLGGSDVTVDVEPGLTVSADRLRLQQMLVNLGTNAQRHGEPPVVIGARRTPSGVEISVRDHGAGVPPANRSLLFERLNRTEGNPESVGLGLWIVRLLAQAHGGDASYRPTEPGSEFVISLPAGASPPPGLGVQSRPETAGQPGLRPG
jgi:signal transduction histidine kinase